MYFFSKSNVITTLNEGNYRCFQRKVELGVDHSGANMITGHIQTLLLLV